VCVLGLVTGGFNTVCLECVCVCVYIYIYVLGLVTGGFNSVLLIIFILISLICSVKMLFEGGKVLVMKMRF